MRDFDELCRKVRDLELQRDMLMEHVNGPLVRVHDQMYSGEQKTRMHEFIRNMLQSESPGFYQVYLNRHLTDAVTVQLCKFRYDRWETIGLSTNHPGRYECATSAICDTIVSGCDYPT